MRSLMIITSPKKTAYNPTRQPILHCEDNNANVCLMMIGFTYKTRTFRSLTICHLARDVSSHSMRRGHCRQVRCRLTASSYEVNVFEERCHNNQSQLRGICGLLVAYHLSTSLQFVRLPQQECAKDGVIEH